MILTAVGIILLLILVFLLVTWVLWFTFLWLSKLWYETSSTNLNRITVRDLFINSFAVFVYSLSILYNRLNNSISKMSDNTIRNLETLLLIILVVVSFAIGYSRGYGKGYKACSVNYGISK